MLDNIWSLFYQVSFFTIVYNNCFCQPCVVYLKQAYSLLFYSIFQSSSFYFKPSRLFKFDLNRIFYCLRCSCQSSPWKIRNCKTSIFLKGLVHFKMFIYLAILIFDNANPVSLITIFFQIQILLNCSGLYGLGLSERKAEFLQ